MDTDTIKNKIQSKQFHRILVCILIALIAVIIFTIGVEVGFMKASFTYHASDSYYRTFAPDQMHRPMGLEPSTMTDSHGVSGKIISINLPAIVVADQDNTEKTVTIDDDTVLRKLRSTIASKDLAVGDFVVVIGEPDDKGDVDAKFIRVLPPPPALPQSQSATNGTGTPSALQGS